MRYHNIIKDDMRNGAGLRTVLFVSGCSHRCLGCHNPITHDSNGGIEFDQAALDELLESLKPKWVEGLTLSGGDPLYWTNLMDVELILELVKSRYPEKNIWVYTGYTWEAILKDKDRRRLLPYIDVLVDGRFEKDKADITYHWAGSTNQRVIDVQKSLLKREVVLYE